MQIWNQSLQIIIRLKKITFATFPHPVTPSHPDAACPDYFYLATLYGTAKKKLTLWPHVSVIMMDAA
jgi:hypothetical protein